MAGFAGVQPRAPTTVTDMVLSRSGLASLVTLFLVACGNLTVLQPDRLSPRSPPQLLQDGVEALVRPVLAQRETPGLVLGLLDRDGPPRFFSFGRGEQSGGELGPDTLFPIGSLSKGFVAGLLALLVDEGLMRWEDSLAELLPAEHLSPDAARITLLQLATHSGGLPRQPYDLGLLADLTRFSFTGHNFSQRMDGTQLRDFLAGFRAPPAARPQYSNIGYALIGWAIETRCKETLPSLLRRKLLRPLGLYNTGYLPEDLPSHSHRAQGHVGDQPKFMRRGAPVADWQFPAALHGAAGLYSSARDLLAFAAAHRCNPTNPGNCPTRLHAVLADNLQVRIPQPEDAPGIGWVTDLFDGLALTNQVGMAVGHTSYLGIDRAHGRAAVVLQTSFNWNFKIGHALLQRLARGQIVVDGLTAP
ncbi:MAG: serine hydrolase domain-containing protein [Inhella sp.]